MHIISMLLLPALFLLSGVLCAVPVAVESVPTFEFRNQLTGEILTCAKCPPGTHMTAHCTASTPTGCAPCRSEHFTELWNYLPRCLYCNNICSENQEVETECSPMSNRVCRCTDGFYWANDFCVRHSECEPGQGVQAKGTSQTNTVCEPCSNDSFSSSSFALETCVKHQECASGKTELLPGSVYHDTVCGTCEELANGGETLRTFLSGFLAMHRMRVAKMKRFVTRYIDKSVPRQRGPLLLQIRAWLAQAPEEQLRKLPQMLQMSQLSSMAEKLQKRLLEIKLQSPGCSLCI
ncbi:putative tumor necrosis factor receptor superfamily member 11B-like [Scophthalmus maximus]|uniref:Putative tumor necrosis factor receptor superfamily member 11B-like n=1 Tax=Scophthalmus maximus TaxID=52904 RepID=A0A2U9AYX3_SCOMX|nr:putative tumor necrosis factor receptor superfamily member 11B-like [Scophthalmus maximus]